MQNSPKFEINSNHRLHKIQGKVCIVGLLDKVDVLLPRESHETVGILILELLYC